MVALMFDGCVCVLCACGCVFVLVCVHTHSLSIAVSMGVLVFIYVYIYVYLYEFVGARVGVYLRHLYVRGFVLRVRLLMRALTCECMYG